MIPNFLMKRHLCHSKKIRNDMTSLEWVTYLWPATLHMVYFIITNLYVQCWFFSNVKISEWVHLYVVCLMLEYLTKGNNLVTFCLFSSCFSTILQKRETPWDFMFAFLDGVLSPWSLLRVEKNLLPCRDEFVKNLSQFW